MDCKEGAIQTKPIGPVIEEQTKVADAVAEQKEYEEDPIRAKTAIYLIETW